MSKVDGSSLVGKERKVKCQTEVISLNVESKNTQMCTERRLVITRDGKRVYRVAPFPVLILSLVPHMRKAQVLISTELSLSAEYSG